MLVDSLLRHRWLLLGLFVLLVNLYVLTEFNFIPTKALSQSSTWTTNVHIHENQNAIPQSKENAPTPTTPPPKRLPSINDPIVFSLVMYGQESATEGLVALKSVLMYASRPVDFHIITSKDAVPIIESRMKLISRPPYPINVFYYPIEREAIHARAVRAGVDTKYMAGMGGLAKVFIHELLPTTVPKAIFFDTDMLFVTDPYLLWRRFEKFVPPQMISFTDLGPNSAADVICTCVMLLDLDAMRNSNRPLMSSRYFGPNARPLGTTEVFRKHGVDPKNPEFGDQGLYWAIWMEYRQYFAHLSIGWDTSHCRFSYGMTLDGPDTMTEQEHIKTQADTRDVQDDFEQLFPGILHFNCQENIVWDDAVNTKRKRWGAYVSLAIDYKWIWFNKGDGTAHVKTTTITHTGFWDEKVGGVRHRKGGKARLGGAA